MPSGRNLAGRWVRGGDGADSGSQRIGLADAFKEAMDDDFNTAKALADIGEAMRVINELCDMKAKTIKKLERGRQGWLATIAKLASDVRETCGVLGLCGGDPATVLEELRDFSITCRNLDRTAIENKISQREAARQAKDWALSDSLRDELAQMGVELRDSPNGTVWKVVR